MIHAPRLRTSHSILALVLAGMLATGGTSAQSYAGMESVDRIAAVVNEDVILRSELDRAVANIRAQYAGKEDQLPPPEVLERQVLERLILTRLQIERATDAGITVSDEELEQAVRSVGQQNNMDVDQLRARLAQDGMSFTSFRNNLRDEIVRHLWPHRLLSLHLLPPASSSTSPTCWWPRPTARPPSNSPPRRRRSRA